MATQAELPAEDPARLLQLHIAEYTAITNRNTYYMSVSFAFWPALILYLTLFLLKTASSMSLTVSLAAIGSDLIAWGWYFCMVEQYKNVRYIETKLRPKLSQLLQTSEFWWYELERHSPTDIQWLRIIGDIWAAAVVLLPAAYFSLRYPPGSRVEWWACLISVGAGISVLALTSQAIVERRKFEKGLRVVQTSIETARMQTKLSK